jgi:two-component system, NarL family, sensor histidine kinase UhpB
MVGEAATHAYGYCYVLAPQCTHTVSNSGECVVAPIGNGSLFSEAWPMRSLRPHQARTPSRRRFRRLGGGAFGLSIGDRLDSVEPMTSTPPATRSSLDARPTRAPADSGVAPGEATRRHPMSLLWWVFLANGAVLLLALLLLTFTPIEIHAPIEIEQFALLLVGFVLLIGLNLVLLRRVLAPLFRLTEVMSSVDPDKPGRRLSGVDPRSAEGQAMARAFNAMLDRLESARHEAARTALAAQEAERLRVARELHDEIGQTLTAVTIQAERAADGDPAQASHALRGVADAVRESLDEVRRIARELRPEALDDLGLVNALIALCTRIGAQNGPRVKRELQGTLPPLSTEVELVLYRIAQESLTNALRHADARSATVSLEADADAVTLSVADDGKGLPVELPRDTAGIAGMRERALLVGGRLTIDSRPGEGTEVRLTIPLDGENS